MKVSDEDFDFMIDVMRGHAEASDCDHSRELADTVRSELLALRKVADAAAALSRALSAHSGGRWDALRDALKAAGQ